MNIPIYQVDAFNNHVFGGNPAAVCPLQEWIEKDLMQKIAEENNLSETAFFVFKDDYFEIRWFTPKVEINLAGHPTLAAAWVIFNELNYSKDKIKLLAIQLSERIGKLECEYLGERVRISGTAKLFMKGEIYI